MQTERKCFQNVLRSDVTQDVTSPGLNGVRLIFGACLNPAVRVVDVGVTCQCGFLFVCLLLLTAVFS